MERREELAISATTSINPTQEQETLINVNERLDECECNYRGRILSKLGGSVHWHYPKVHTEKQQLAISLFSHILAILLK